MIFIYLFYFNRSKWRCTTHSWNVVDVSYISIENAGGEFGRSDTEDGVSSCPTIHGRTLINDVIAIRHVGVCMTIYNDQTTPRRNATLCIQHRSIFDGRASSTNSCFSFAPVNGRPSQNWCSDSQWETSNFIGHWDVAQPSNWLNILSFLNHHTLWTTAITFTVGHQINRVNCSPPTGLKTYIPLCVWTECHMVK